MKTDLHGLTIAEATKIVLEIIDKTRLNRSTITLELVTGQGKMQKEMIALLKDYQCEATIRLGNNGIIVAEIE